ncbi:MAG: divalent-cation tolerance protein CutA [Burkholderiales bacterium]|nr:divalent-cation tolerance protein CutA [Burkholderiales bacterium]OJX08922.1 MAG: divalent-cation tolerance protein CutA [Burkholderiales bacterium 70-64]
MSASERSIPQPVRAAPPDALLLILSNVPDAATASRIAQVLVEERLAACVNILGACRSVYRWQGAIEHAEEVPLLVKTTRRRHAACRQRLKELHPYEVPEIVTVSPAAVWPAYADWAIAETRAPPGRAR